MNSVYLNYYSKWFILAVFLNPLYSVCTYFCILLYYILTTETYIVFIKQHIIYDGVMLCNILNYMKL